MAKCRAEDIKDKVKVDLVKDYPNLNTSKIKLLRIEEIVFKIARAQLLSLVKVNATEQALSDRLDRLKLEKIDKTSGTIEIDTLKNDEPKPKNTASKTKGHTLSIGGLSILYETVPVGSITSLASTSAGTGRIRIQEGLTAEKVAKYLLNSEEVEGASKETKSKTTETRNRVVGLLYREYGINIMDVLRAMKEDDQLLRSFLLLHEYRHTLQLKKSGSKAAFMKAYNEDPVKFELDADLFALKALKSEIDLIKDMADKDFSLTKAGYTVEKNTNTSSTINEETVANEITLQGTPIAEVGDQIGDNESIEEEVATNTSTGFNGYVHIKDTGGKGTPEGDAKDKAMRKVADGFVGEVSGASDEYFGESIEKATSSTATSMHEIGLKAGGIAKYESTFRGNYVLESGRLTPTLTMLARNGKLKGRDLNDVTKSKILRHFNNGASFVVGDMPGVDTEFIEYLDEIGASYKVYTTNASGKEFDREGIDGSKYRKKESSKQKDDTMSSNIVDRTTNNIAKEAKECANNGM